jgi:hypothetical protein
MFGRCIICENTCRETTEFSLQTGIFRIYPSQTWYIYRLFTPNIIQNESIHEWNCTLQQCPHFYQNTSFFFTKIPLLFSFNIQCISFNKVARVIRVEEGFITVYEKYFLADHSSQEIEPSSSINTIQYNTISLFPIRAHLRQTERIQI